MTPRCKRCLLVAVLVMLGTLAGGAWAFLATGSVVSGVVGCLAGGAIATVLTGNL